MVIYGDLGIVNSNNEKKTHGSLRWDLNARKKLQEVWSGPIEKVYYSCLV